MAPFTPLVRPRRYFRRSDRPSLVIASLAVLAVGLATASVVFWEVQPLVGMLDFPSHDGAFFRMNLILEHIRTEARLAVILTLVSWIVYAILVWLVVRVVTDEGELRSAIGVVGEATLAVLAVFPLKLLAFWHFVTTTSDPTANAALGMPTVYWGSLPLLVVSILGLGWKIGVVAGGLVTVSDLDWRRATAAAAVFGAITSPFVTIVAYYALPFHLA